MKLHAFAFLVLIAVLPACGYPLSPTQLAVSTVPESGFVRSPTVCGLGVRDGEHVTVLRSCTGKFYFLPYELSSDAAEGLDTTSLELKGAGISVFLIDLSISERVRAELSKFANSLGVRDLPPYPIQVSKVVPATFFPDGRNYRVTMKENSFGSDKDISRTVIIQVIGEKRAEEFTRFLSTPNAFSAFEYVDLPLSDGSSKLVSIQLRAGNLKPTNLTQ